MRGWLGIALLATALLLLVAGIVLEQASPGASHSSQVAAAGLVAVAIATFALPIIRPTATPDAERLQSLNDRVQKGIEKLRDLQWELSDNESRYRDLLDAQTDIITRCDAQGRLTFVNRAFCRVFGVEAGDVIGTSFSPEVLQREGDDGAPPEPGRRQRFEQLVATIDGARWFAFERQAITDDSGQLREIQQLGRDVTEQRRILSVLAEARDQAEAANRAKSRFLAAMSHEIRTPMNGILGMTDLLGETQLSNEQRSYLNAVDHSAKTLLTIIDEILDLSKIEAGKLEIHPAPFALDRCVQSVVELMAPRAREKRLDIAWRIDPLLPRMVVGDEMRVRQVLLNLVGNAIKFTDVGGVALRVKSWTGMPAGAPNGSEAHGPFRLGVLFEIEDTGAGIAHDQIRNIFAEFGQADDAACRKQSGTGLGLAISRSLAQAMGGDIHVHSEPGHGSTFTASIVVLGQAATSPVLQVAEDRGARNILVVSNRLQQRVSMVETLRSLGIAATLTSFDSAMEIVDPTNSPGFDAVIADSEDGVERVGRLVARARAGGKARVRAVVVVDHPGGEGLEAFRDAGCDSYLVRPVRPGSLLAQLGLGVVNGEARTGRAATPASHRPVGGPAPPRRRILLVEDNEINALLARRMSEKAGCLVHHASSGADALACCAELMDSGDTVDLVLMDIHMPGMDGFEAARRAKRLFFERGCAAPPVVALTANAFAEDRRRCLEAGFEDFLAKPFDRADLEALLEKWCASEREARDGSLGEFAA